MRFLGQERRWVTGSAMVGMSAGWRRDAWGFMDETCPPGWCYDGALGKEGRLSYHQSWAPCFLGSRYLQSVRRVKTASGSTSQSRILLSDRKAPSERDDSGMLSEITTYLANRSLAQQHKLHAAAGFRRSCRGICHHAGTQARAGLADSEPYKAIPRKQTQSPGEMNCAAAEADRRS